MIRKQLLTIIILAFTLPIMAQKIDRKSVVMRNNPHVTSLDTLSALTVGNGHFAFTVDATGLQTFPAIYRNGIPLGTMSDWGWHYFANKENYKTTETLVNHDFHRGHKEELYAAQFKTPGRQRDASNYYRSNPHRMHLGYVGLDLSDPARVNSIDQQLDMWTGKIDSRFKYGETTYHVQTVCDPAEDLVASRIESDGNGIAVRLRIPYPSGKHSDDASDWEDSAKVHITYTKGLFGKNTTLLKVTMDNIGYYIDLAWNGEAEFYTRGNTAFISTKKDKLDFYCRFHVITAEDLVNGGAEFYPTPFNDFAMLSAGHWADFWTEGGFIDFGNVKDARAKELERRVILSQYLMAAQEAGMTPPQETGLTYNSWFGKFHLEMVSWHLAWMALWNHTEMMDEALDWYHSVMPQATNIAKRQGFKGARWMKMTDPMGIEAPSNTGSYLIWQQPHPIYLAELMYRSYDTDGIIGDGDTIPNPRQKAHLTKYADIVQRTAEFMADFAEYDSIHDRYILRGCIPAQESLKADSTINPPFELSYWLTTLKMAQQWRKRLGAQPIEKWDDIIKKLSPLAYNEDSLYLAAESAVETYKDRRFTSDHPALLGAMGLLPQSRLIDNKVMAKTLDWVWDNWNWDKTWGWDFPMVAMTCARLGQPSRAVDALLMDKQKNTYLPNGHNYQDKRLRVYMPGNGGLLQAVAMMCAGWDGSTKEHPGFPDDWDIRYENINKMP